MHDLRDALSSCCNEFLRDGKETDTMNYVSVLDRINGIIEDIGLSDSVKTDVIVISDEICLRMNICGNNYSLAFILISNGKITFKDIDEDEFYDAVSILIRKYHLLESHK